MYDKTKINLNKEVKEVEKLLNSYINSEQSTVNEACQYLLSSGVNVLDHFSRLLLVNLVIVGQKMLEQSLRHLN